ncbi:MAG: endolytic transglycosylase MltG [Oscillospiraceae bacterium]|nr:endolytic transglycosylase MltG [Oscillospiraceae bacterium]
MDEKKNNKNQNERKPAGRTDGRSTAGPGGMNSAGKKPAAPKSAPANTRRFDPVPTSDPNRGNIPISRSSGILRPERSADDNRYINGTYIPRGKQGPTVSGGENERPQGRSILRAPQNAPAPAPERKPPAREAPKNAEKRPKKSNNRNVYRSLLTTVIIMIFVVAAAMAASIAAISCINDIFAINRTNELITVSIDEKLATSEIISILKDNSLIKNEQFCNLAIKFLKIDEAEYIEGIYDLSPSMGLEGMLSRLKSTSTSSKSIMITFPEGYTIDQIIEKLDKNGVCSAANLYKTIEEKDFTKDYPFLAAVPNKQDRYQLLEGYLYPDTYEFYIGENPYLAIKRFLDNFRNKWTEDYQKLADDMGYSIDDAITLAAIIERESANTKEMKTISGILQNRINNKTGLFKRLECDATKSYIPKVPEGRLAPQRITELSNRYDTYIVEDLPAGPICNPGNAAIESVLKPEKTKYMFFRHDVNRKVYYAVTDAEHYQNGLAVQRVNNSSN